MLRINYFVATIFIMLPLSGCIKITALDRSQNINLNSAYTTSTQIENADNDLPVNIGWWELYEDDELNDIMQHAFSNNPNISQMRARLNQTQALLTQSRSSLTPSLNITADRSTYSGDNAPPSDFMIIGAASFEIDLWGKNRASINSAKLQSDARAEDIYAAKISISASIVQNWLEVLSLLEQATLINKQIKTNKTVLELQQKRFEMGAASALDILQQQEILARSEALLPDIISRQKIATNNISLLLGNIGQGKLTVTAKKSPKPLPIPNSGIPSDLLENRPDIMAAWLRLKSSKWTEKVAWAKRLPSFNLSATGTTSAAALNGLFNSWLLDLATGIAAPILDGGNKKAEQIRQEAISDERYHAYKETVIGAVIDVENALIRNKYQDQKLDKLEQQIVAANKTLEQAHLSYINGKSNYINVLNSLNNTQKLEQQIVAEKLLQAKERISLYRALGGRSWAIQQ